MMESEKFLGVKAECTEIMFEFKSLIYRYSMQMTTKESYA